MLCSGSSGLKSDLGTSIVRGPMSSDFVLHLTRKIHTTISMGAVKFGKNVFMQFFKTYNRPVLLHNFGYSKINVRLHKMRFLCSEVFIFVLLC